MTEMDLDRIIDTFTEHPEQTPAAEPMATETQSFPIAVAPEFQAVNLDFEEPLFPVENLPPSQLKADFLEAAEEVFELDNPALEVVVEVAAPAEASEAKSEGLEDEILLKEIAQIPNKLAFKIGEVAEIVGVKQYVLRYWETEFEALRPKKSKQNQRMYTRKDIENILLIKKLLYRDKFSIEGARKALRGLKTQIKEIKQWDQVADRYEHAIALLGELKSEIQLAKRSIGASL